uniref:Coat protein 2 n=1 Tax=Shenzhen reo-like virus 4 TaxID=2789382 RepID=A0A7S8WJU4_9REOV|nr:coat protein 2 [Shenzhen reo-like virus 4]
MPVSTEDMQSLPQRSLIMSALENEQSGTVSPVDQDFQKAFPQYLPSIQSVHQVIDDTVRTNPTALGIPGTQVTNESVEIDVADNRDRLQMVGFRPSSLEQEALDGMLDIFSTETLTTPLNKHPLLLSLRGNLYEEKEINVPVCDFAEWPAGTVDVAYLNKHCKPWTIRVPILVDSGWEGLDMSKSILEQDWSVAINPVHLPAQLSSFGPTLHHMVESFALPDHVTSCGNSKVIPVHDLIDVFSAATAHFDKLPADTHVARGLRSGVPYTRVELAALGSSLNALWSRLKAIKLPSLKHVQMGSEILAAGLGVAGHVTGQAGLVKASDVFAVIGGGLGTLGRVMEPTSNAKKPTPAAAIQRNALSIVPNLFKAGQAALEATWLDSATHVSNNRRLATEIINSFRPLGAPSSQASVLMYALEEQK